MIVTGSDNSRFLPGFSLLSDFAPLGESGKRISQSQSACEPVATRLSEPAGGDDGCGVVREQLQSWFVGMVGTAVSTHRELAGLFEVSHGRRGVPDSGRGCNEDRDIAFFDLRGVQEPSARALQAVGPGAERQNSHPPCR